VNNQPTGKIKKKMREMETDLIKVIFGKDMKSFLKKDNKSTRRKKIKHTQVKKAQQALTVGA
jgi:hypothetical protein